MRLCVPLSPCIYKYYSMEIENVINIRKTRKGRETMKQRLRKEQLSESFMRAGQQMASLLTLPSKITTALQSKVVPTVSLGFPLISYTYNWLVSLKAETVSLLVVDGNGDKEFILYKDLEPCVKKTIDLLIEEL